MANDSKVGKLNRHSRQSFLHGALILTVGMAIVKVIGALFKIPLMNIIGETGMGFFNTSYSFYSVVYSIATAGFPIAIARMVSESYTVSHYNDVRKVKRVATPIFLLLGIAGTLVMMIGAPIYCGLWQSDYDILPMIVLAPTIFFCCAGSIYRGYYEGLRNMYPTAISEIVEALAKLIIGLGAAIALTTYCGSEYEANGTIFGMVMKDASDARLFRLSMGAAGGILGVSIGAMLSTLYLFIRDKRVGDGITQEMYRASPKPHEGRSVAKKLVMIAVPIAIGSIGMSVSGFIDMTLVQTRMADIVNAAPQILLSMYKGMLDTNIVSNPETPKFLYGCYGAALTVYMLVPTVTQAFGTSALPSVTESWTKGDRKEIKSSIEAVLRISAMFSIPAGLGIAALATPIVKVIYMNRASTPIISNSLFILGFAAICAAISTPISAMLQAVGRVDLPVKVLGVALVLKIVTNYILCGIPEINISGAGTGTLICYFFQTVCELILLSKVTGISINFKSTFLKPLAAGLICAASAFGIYQLLAMFLDMDRTIYVIIGLGCAVLAAVIIYAIFMVIFRGIDKNDILMLPKGQKIAKTLEKRGWI